MVHLSVKRVLIELTWNLIVEYEISRKPPSRITIPNSKIPQMRSKIHNISKQTVLITVLISANKRYSFFGFIIASIHLGKREINPKSIIATNLDHRDK